MNAATGFTLDQVAERAEVHYQTVYRWVRAGRLAAAKVGGSYRVDPDELERFLERRREPVSPPAPAQPRIERQRRSMGRALVDGDETRVRAIARQLLTNGLTVTQLIEQVLVPPLADIGTAWRNGDLHIYVERRASAIVERLLGEISPNPRGRRRGTVVVAALTGDLHSLPTTMAAAALRDDNWKVEHLGSDVPPAELARVITDQPVDLVVISATMPNADRIEAATTLVGDELGVPAIVGGPGSTLGDLQEAARRALRTRS